MFLRTKQVLFVLLAAVLFVPAVAAQSGSIAGSSSPVAPGNVVAEIHRLINLKRSIRNMPPLRLNDTLSALAHDHSRRMATDSVEIGHDGFEERGQIIEKSWKGSFPMGENVTEGEDAEEAVDLWWNSPGHKDNLMGEWTDTGIGVAWNGEIWLCTQIFVRR